MRLETDQEALKDFVKTSYFSQGKKEKKQPKPHFYMKANLSICQEHGEEL